MPFEPPVPFEPPLTVNHFVKASLNDDRPDKIIICGGTNNLTKKKQSPLEIANEIIEIVETCRSNGVKEIYVSSLICRPFYQKQINEVNKILKHYSGIYKFIYIDNYAIKEVHLWKDNIQLNTDGIYKLANNYICHLNRPSLLPLENIWN